MCHLIAMDAFANYFQRMKRLLLRKGRSREEAEDLIQEAFLRMQAYCERGGKVREPEGFLVRTVMRLAINAKRDEHSDLYAHQNAEDLAAVADTRPLPDEVLAADQCLNRMRDALDAVSRRTRDIFFMHRLDGLSHAQIAQQMNLSISSVEKHIARAMVVLIRANVGE